MFEVQTLVQLVNLSFVDGIVDKNNPYVENERSRDFILLLTYFVIKALLWVYGCVRTHSETRIGTLYL